MRTVPAYGIVLKTEGGFVCWNSFKSRFELGPRRLSEIFPFGMLWRTNKRANQAIQQYPNACAIYEPGDE